MIETMTGLSGISKNCPLLNTFTINFSFLLYYSPDKYPACSIQ